jgi:hypothetical protein
VPSKTFHFGPDSEDALLDLFRYYLDLTSLLVASTSIVAGARSDAILVSAAIIAGDRAWTRFWRTVLE